MTTEPVRYALGRFTEAARAFAAIRDSALGAATGPDAARVTRANQALLQVERRLTRPEGLVSRPWMRSLQFASDVDNGYSNMAFPSVNEAIRYADEPTTGREIQDLASRIDQAREAIERATAAFR